MSRTTFYEIDYGRTTYRARSLLEAIKVVIHHVLHLNAIYGIRRVSL